MAYINGAIRTSAALDSAIFVVLQQLCDENASLIEAAKDATVDELSTSTPVEAFEKGILGCLAHVDELQFDVLAFGQVGQYAADSFCTAAHA